MTGASPLVVSRGTAIAVVAAVLATGAGVTWLVMRNPAAPASLTSSAAPPETRAARDAAVAGATAGPLPDLIVPLTAEAVDRARIVVTTVAARAIGDEIRLPGVVQPNAYHQVSVTSLVGGRVLRVSAQLGDRVRRGQVIAAVYSPELAEARTKYVAARAMLEAHDRELKRAQTLVDAGAASQQELERIHAEHIAQVAEVESARSRLKLLGADVEAAPGAEEASATTEVRAPIDGVVTERLANAGLNVDPATKLLTIVDLSSVWVVADVYERDLHRVREGVSATVRAQAFPEHAFIGRVTYIDPQLNEATRTARARVEVGNPDRALRLGMFADVVVMTTGSAAAPSVPRSAVQSVGSEQVVYLASRADPTRFIERAIRTGRMAGDLIEVVSGVHVGDWVVSQGAFSIRAEAERLGLRSTSGRAVVKTGSRKGSAATEPEITRVVVSDKGFEPSSIGLRRGVPTRLTFLRTTDKTCATGIVIPSLEVKRPLPLNQPVTIEFTPAAAGDIDFTCSMSMLKGVAVVR